MIPDRLSDVRVILIALAVIVVFGLLVGLIGYPMLILSALTATFAVFVLIITLSVGESGKRMNRETSWSGRRRQPRKRLDWVFKSFIGVIFPPPRDAPALLSPIAKTLIAAS